jgi:mRNA-degrading endonuclease RelE of RelBE toxin-antitoxin system
VICELAWILDRRYADDVADDLDRVPANVRAWILDEVEVQLGYEPMRQTRNRKVLIGVVPPWEHVNAVWELRVGAYRVFYDVDDGELSVVILGIRHKPPHRTTKEIL